MDFPALPKDFVFGVSAASYQIEGAVGADGRGVSIWDTFTAEPGRIRNGDTGDVACDHYHRYREDVAMMKELGVDAYRFSIAWPRIQPTGRGAANEAGLDFYDRLVDELLAAGITPAATLYHWDLPQALEDAGGWTVRDTAERLAEYAGIVGARLGDRVGMWMPLNEPVVVTMFGYAMGAHAPGRQLGFGALPVAHHQLLGHGLSVQALRAAGCANIGIASNHAPTWPASDSAEDKQAAEIFDALVNWTFADPILRGEYPDPLIAAAMPGPVAADLKVIAEPLDWFGINYYQPALVGAPGSGESLLPGVELPFDLRTTEGYPKTDFGWSVVPDGLREILAAFKDRYGDALPPVYITESGCSYHDTVGPDGAVHDQRRIDYHDQHLRALAESGVDVRGYFAWSIMDNFEWAEGFTERFGLVHVDYDTLKRTPKDSFGWYRDLIRSRQ
ncbi:Beta-glucosidase [Alloactinosynnema sp. L-07]|uniref:GH1 family beta-glucosidase n=1 Tax=Alloactinosynnema sp. L-07 TaxID=1653480 RepID=UPI00065EF996|nr:GH1 family beta-glucosidase [Alloactinosynnema sp. L-07]CRK58815.1 Beta-glucosidase [Alloactinosynnema sp. L-07]